MPELPPIMRKLQQKAAPLLAFPISKRVYQQEDVREGSYGSASVIGL
jgi:hypothetical protein